MLVLFDEKNREYLRIFQDATEEMKAQGIEIDEQEVPVKDGYNTVIYNVDGKVEYKFEEIKKEKSIKELEQELEEEKKKNKISMLGLMEVNNRLRILENDKGVK